jgi:predicted Mrr-cat superfamily restriction endonuclease
MPESAKVWAIRPSNGEEAKRFAPLFWEKGVAAIDYVGSRGAADLHGYTLPELKEVVRRVKAESGMSTDKSAVTNAANQLWRFANEIRVNDWILSPKPKPDDVMIGRCITAYEYAPGRLDENQFPYIIGVDWMIDIPSDWLSEDLRSSIKGKRQSLFPIKDRHIQELESLCKLSLEYRNVPVNLPAYLVQGVDELVGERGRKHFIVYLVMKGLEEAAEELSKGEEEFDAIINPVTNPEWATSAMVYAWVRASRDLDNERTEEKWRDRSPS